MSIQKIIAQLHEGKSNVWIDNDRSERDYHLFMDILIPALESAENLRGLSISGKNFPEDDLIRILNASKEHISSLYLNVNTMGSMTAHTIANMTGNLEKLEVFSDIELIPLELISQAIAQSENLQELRLFSLQLTNQGAAILRHGLESCSPLTSFALSIVPKEQQTPDILFNIKQPLPNLTDLYLNLGIETAIAREKNVEYALENFIHFAGNCPMLEKLWISGMGHLTKQHLSSIGNFINRHASIEELTLSSGTSIRFESAPEFLQALQSNKLLQTLRMEYMGLNDSDAEHIAHAFGNNKRTRLSLSHNEIGDDGSEMIANKIAWPWWKVSSLHLYGNRNISENGAQLLIEAMKRNTSLGFLDLGENSNGNRYAKAITRDMLHDVLNAVDIYMATNNAINEQLTAEREARAESFKDLMLCISMQYPIIEGVRVKAFADDETLPEEKTTSPDRLLECFNTLTAKKDLTVSEDAQDVLRALFAKAIEKKPDVYGSSYFALYIFKSTLKKMSNTCKNSGTTPSNDITTFDVFTDIDV